MPQLYTNNASSALASSISDVASSLTVTTGHGSKFPSPTGGDFFLLTLVGLDGNGNENAWEIVKCTARSTDTLTITRAQESTTAASWNAGTRVELRPTAGTLAQYAALASPTFTGTPAAPTAAVDTNTTQIATTAYVVGQGYLKSSTASSTYAPLASPALTGTPTAPTAAVDTNTTQVATTAYVVGQSYLKSATASSTYLPLTGGTLTGNLTFSGTSRRIIGDFSNGTLNSRTLVQTSTTNSETSLGVVPNGTSRVANSAWFNTADPTNSGYLTATVSDTQAQIMTGGTGSGSAVPLIIGTGGTVRLTCGLSGAIDLSTGLREYKVAVSASDIDVRAGNYFTKTISGSTTFTISNNPAANTVAAFILELTNAGSNVIYWSGVKWAGGSAPSLTASGVDILGFYTHDGGTTWRGMLLSKDSK